MFANFCRRRIRVYSLQEDCSFFAWRCCSFSSETCSPSVCGNDPQKNFTVSYLINSCGLSSDAAASASKKLFLKTPKKPDAVLKLLREYGFTDAQILRVVTRWPSILVSCPGKNLLPKLEFFRSIGVPLPVLAQRLSTQPSVLTRSLNNSIIPAYDGLRSVLQSDEMVVNVFSRTPSTFGRCWSNGIASNISMLRERGVPESSVASMLMGRPSVMVVKNKLAESVDLAHKMGFNLSKITFTHAVRVLVCVKDSTLEHKKEVYRRCGWSESDIKAAFLRCPSCMNISEKKIVDNMNFLVDNLGCEPAAIAQFPVIVNLSLEKRIKPRCLVAGVLSEKGLLKKTAPGMATLLKLPEDKFMEKYIIKYEKEIPELLDIYRGKSSREAEQLHSRLLSWHSFTTDIMQ